MISRRAQENLAVIALAAVFVGVIVMSLDYGPRARMVPLPVATFGLVLALIQLVWQNLRSSEDLHVDIFASMTRRAERSAAEQPQEPEGARAQPQARRPRWQRELAAYGVVAALVGLIFLVGPIAAVFVFSAGYFLGVSRYSWRRGLVYTIALTAGVYLLFVVALDIQLYHGVLEPLVERLR